MPNPKHASGFTMVELMIAITIAAILMAVAVPSFKDASLNSQLRASANSLVASAHLARSEAFKRNAVVRMCVNSSGTSCGTGGWEQGWIVVVLDSLGNEVVLDRQSAAPPGFKITAAGGTASFQFQPTGVGATADVLKVCRATPTVGAQEREVSIEASGRVYAARTTDGACS